MKTIIVKTTNGHDVWTLSPDCIKAVRPIAREFSMSVEEFLTRYTTNRQDFIVMPEHKNTWDDPGAAPHGFEAPSIRNHELRKRIERTAEFFGKSVVDLVWEAIAREVVMAESMMILSPKTGRPIGDSGEFDNYRTHMHRECPRSR